MQLCRRVNTRPTVFHERPQHTQQLLQQGYIADFFCRMLDLRTASQTAGSDLRQQSFELRECRPIACRPSAWHLPSSRSRHRLVLLLVILAAVLVKILVVLIVVLVLAHSRVGIVILLVAFIVILAVLAVLVLVVIVVPHEDRTCVAGGACALSGLMGTHLSDGDALVVLDTCGAARRSSSDFPVLASQLGVTGVMPREGCDAVRGRGCRGVRDTILRSLPSLQRSGAPSSQAGEWRPSGLRRRAAFVAILPLP